MQDDRREMQIQKYEYKQEDRRVGGGNLSREPGFNAG
jgi:hypothetical protein